MVLGVLFWGSVILTSKLKKNKYFFHNYILANFISAAQSRQKTTFLTSTCQLGSGFKIRGAVERVLSGADRSSSAPTIFSNSAFPLRSKLFF